MHVLDDPIRSALLSRHAGISTINGSASRYPLDIAPFGTVPPTPTADDWAALAPLTADDAAAMFVPADFVVPDGWVTHLDLGLVQLTDDAVETVDPADDIVALGPQDVEAMLELTALTKPGPFLPRTIVFGGYVGIRDGDQLVAMAGRRLSMDGAAGEPGWVEISAVCTHPSARGRGYARRLVAEVVRGVRAEGDRAFLHAAVGNPAQRVYEAMGFVVRRDDLKVVDVQPAADVPAAPPAPLH